MRAIKKEAGKAGRLVDIENSVASDQRGVGGGPKKQELMQRLSPGAVTSLHVPRRS